MNSVLEAQIELAEQEWMAAWQRGPTRTRWKKPPLQIGDPAPNLKLQDQTGKIVQLQDFWKNGPALLLFWRHYGCSCGMDRARRLQSEYPEYVKQGASVVVIGQGEPERAAEYARKNNITCPVLCDPTYQAYETYDLLEGMPSQIFFDSSDELLRCDVEAAIKLAESRHGTDRAVVDSPGSSPAGL